MALNNMPPLGASAVPGGKVCVSCAWEATSVRWSDGVGFTGVYSSPMATASLAGCEIRRGVVWRRIITVPLSRIQHSDVTQGPLQRAYGLATLTLYTAGTEHAKIDLHGLAFDTAMNIRQYLFERSETHDR